MKRLFQLFSTVVFLYIYIVIKHQRISKACIFLQMFFLSTSENPLERLRVWWNFSTFNQIDLLILLIALVGFILRMIPGGWYCIYSFPEVCVKQQRNKLFQSTKRSNFILLSISTVLQIFMYIMISNKHAR